MLSYNLPELPPNKINVRKFSGLIDTDAVNETWSEIISTVRDLASAIDELEVAAARNRYALASDVSRLTASLLYAKDMMGRKDAVSRSLRLSTDTDIDYDTSLYSSAVSMPGGFWDAITLPIEREENYARGANVRIIKACGREIEGNDIGALSNGSEWRAVVRTDDISMIEPSAEFYQAAGGVPCIIEVELKRPYLINCVAIEPSTALPMDLIAVECHNTSGEIETIVSPRHADPDRRSVLLRDRYAVAFPPVLTKRVRLVLNQRHYRRVDDARSDRVYYEYEYGISSLFVGRIRYQAAGQWISREIELPPDTEAIRLSADETGPSGGAVEYDIFAEGDVWLPIAPDNREEITEIPKVYLENGRYVAKLRFGVATGLKVYASGVLLLPSVDYVLEGNDKIVFTVPPRIPLAVIYVPEEKHREVSLKEFVTQVSEEFYGADEKNRIYLKHIPYIDKDLIRELPDDWDPSALSSAYVPIVVSIQRADGTRLSQPLSPGGSGIRNITQYKPSIPVTPGDVMNYKVSGSVIEFDRAIDKSYMIIVTYSVIPQAVRLRVTLKHSGTPDMTPLVRNLRITANRRRTV